MHQAAEAARLRRTAITTSEATATATAAAAATTAATATPAISATTTPVTAAIIAPGAATLAGHAIDDVVELAARHCAVGTLLALKHANQADLIDRATDDIERLEQTLRLLRLQPECFGDRADRGIWRCLCGRCCRCVALGGRCVGTFGGRVGGCLGGCLDGSIANVGDRRASH